MLTWKTIKKELSAESYKYVYCGFSINGCVICII